MVDKSKESKKNKKIISHALADKKILWLSKHNKYLIANPPLDEIVEKIYDGEPDENIIEFCNKELGLELEESNQLIKDIHKTLAKKLRDIKSEGKGNDLKIEKKDLKFACRHYYKINNQVFLIEFETPEIEFLIHPKFSQLTTQAEKKIKHHFQIYESDNQFHLKIDGVNIGSWSRGNENFLSGKVSMEILQKITDTKESDWMAVFHAAGVALGDDGILFLGDSGDGKSTLSAILMANGFEVLADDFLPVLSGSNQMCPFPAGISVKEQAVEMLSTHFPELKKTQSYDFHAQGKIVRYLPNPSATNDEPKKVLCKALVFVKYEPDSELEFESLPKDVAFQKLVPDSWISHEEKNAKQFMEWFANLPCWQLKYSDRSAMIETVQKIFEDKL